MSAFLSDSWLHAGLDLLRDAATGGPDGVGHFLVRFADHDLWLEQVVDQQRLSAWRQCDPVSSSWAASMDERTARALFLGTVDADARPIETVMWSSGQQRRALGLAPLDLTTVPVSRRTTLNGADLRLAVRVTGLPGRVTTQLLTFESGHLCGLSVADASDGEVVITVEIVAMFRYLDGRSNLFELLASGTEIVGDEPALQLAAGLLEYDDGFLGDFRAAISPVGPALGRWLELSRTSGVQDGLAQITGGTP